MAQHRIHRSPVRSSSSDLTYDEYNNHGYRGVEYDQPHSPLPEQQHFQNHQSYQQQQGSHSTLQPPSNQYQHPQQANSPTIKSPLPYPDDSPPLSPHAGPPSAYFPSSNARDRLSVDYYEGAINNYFTSNSTLPQRQMNNDQLQYNPPQNSYNPYLNGNNSSYSGDTSYSNSRPQSGSPSRVGDQQQAVMNDVVSQIQSYDLRSITEEHSPKWQANQQNSPSSQLPQNALTPPPLPPKPSPLNLAHSNYYESGMSSDPSTDSKTESKPSINHQASVSEKSGNIPPCLSYPSIAVSPGCDTPQEYNSFFQQNSTSPNHLSAPNSPGKSSFSTSTTTEVGNETPNEAEKTNQNVAGIQRASTFHDYTDPRPSSSIQRSSSVSSYQQSLMTPCTTTQSTPELYGAKVDVNSADWGTFYHLTPEYMASLDKHTITLQNEIHNLIVTEENYVVNTRVFLRVFGTDLADTLEKGREKFRQDAFVTLETVVDINDKMLLKPLKEEQERHGPMLNFIPDAVKDWIIAIREPILWYAERHPYANEVVQEHKANTTQFKAFIDHGSVETTKLVRKEFSSLFENTRTRFGQYHMMFGAILKQIKKLNEEDPIIPKIEECIEECRFTLSKYNEIQGKVGTQLEMARLERSLRFKHAEDRVDLLLSDSGREVVYRGKVKLRKSDVDVMDSLEMILLDHFLLLVHIRNDTDYVITTKPIHLELLVIESVSDDPLFKSNAMAVVSKLTRNKSETGGQLSPRQNSVASAATSSSIGYKPEASATASPRKSGTSGSLSQVSTNSEYFTSISLSHNNNLIYPIKLRNLATDHKYYVCTTSEITRKEWVKKICEAKVKYSKRAMELQHEPLSIHIIDSTSFGYSQLEIPKQSIFTKENALYRALQNQKDTVAGVPPRMLNSSTTHGSFSSVNPLEPISSGNSLSTPATPKPESRGLKSTSFIYCAADVFYNNMRLIFLGMNDVIYGCQIQKTGNPLNWVLIDKLPRVTRIEAMEDKNMLFVLSEKNLYSYKLNEVILSILTQGSIQSHTKVQITPPSLIDQNVDCFKAGMLSNKPYLFYSIYSNKSTVTVLEINGKDHHKKSSRLFGFKNKSHGNEFKETDWLFTPTRNREITFFNSTFCIHTDNSFEVMNLERKQPSTIPISGSIEKTGRKQGLPESDVEHLKKRVNESRPVAINKVPSRAVGPRGVSIGNDFLLCYHKFAIMCDALGDLDTAVPIDYLRKITAAHVWYPYLITFSDRVIEVHELTGGADVHQLVQVVTGRDIRMLGHFASETAPRLVFAMAHPEQRQRQLILEFTLNKNVKHNQIDNTLSYVRAN